MNGIGNLDLIQLITKKIFHLHKKQLFIECAAVILFCICVFGFACLCLRPFFVCLLFVDALLGAHAPRIARRNACALQANRINIKIACKRNERENLCELLNGAEIESECVCTVALHTITLNNDFQVILSRSHFAYFYIR